jgi:hypothetical protein
MRPRIDRRKPSSLVPHHRPGGRVPAFGPGTLRAPGRSGPPHGAPRPPRGAGVRFSRTRAKNAGPRQSSCKT